MKIYFEVVTYVAAIKLHYRTEMHLGSVAMRISRESPFSRLRGTTIANQFLDLKISKVPLMQLRMRTSKELINYHETH